MPPGHTAGENQPILPQNTIFHDGKLYTLNSAPGWRLRGQPVMEVEGREYRSWSPFTSKLAAFTMLGGSMLPFHGSRKVLYLGASFGTTVSHVADILPDATIYAVEMAREPYVGLQEVAATHQGIIPIMDDAFHPERYSAVVEGPDIVIEDIAQKNMLDILVRNIESFRSIRAFFLVVKSRSIDSSASPERIFEEEKMRLESRLKCNVSMKDISRYERDHAVLSGIVPG